MKKINLLIGLILGIGLLLSFKPYDPPAVIQKVYFDNMKEIMLANYAKDKVSNDELRNYVTVLMQDHEALGTELTVIADEMSVDLSNVTTDQFNLPLDSLDKLRPQEFDLWFKNEAIKSHQETIAYFKSVIDDESLQNDKLKAWMNTKVPNLNSHLTTAQGIEIAEQIDNTP